ncbi:TonB-dependent receptor domain-containing protein [Sphingomonas baiyangensis]|uniref:TonB-dependent receptor n=1 Tax=Sphingomonas baiyangensis TaxID=2572576 RepID=A0A4U1L144_9SPHN|nr:TonB-dependent receptor [Sphingomonas baiyangensis]TKD50521.1 TonB-dependent receptor [Sphingomonas baiyangensis]
MTHKLAFGSLLLLTSHFVAPAALAQVSGSGGVSTTTPPAGQVTTPDAGGAAPTTPQTVGPDDTSQQVDQAEQEVEISAPGAGDVNEDIVVIGRNIPNVVRSTAQVISVLSSEDIARTGEGDIAGALTRVTGLSVVGNGFVFVRGLGDRYSSSLLNGLPLPSPEPLRRVVPLDIFPTNLVASALVQKSFSANYPGEFGGGAINLTTRAVPDESFIQIGGSVGFDTATTSQLGYVYDGGSADVFGYDDGTRTVPGFVKDAGINNTGLNPGQTAALRNAETTLLQENDDIPANWGADISMGTSFDVSNDVRIGVIAGGGISNSWRTRQALQQVANSADGGLASDFTAVTTDNRILVNGLLGLGAEVGDHRFRFTNLYIHDTLKQGILSAGDLDNLGIPGPFAPIPTYIEQYTNWFERQLFTSQFVGELDFDALQVDLRGAYANTKRKAPYERAFRYEYTAADGINDYINTLGGTTQTATVAFSDLNEDLWSGAIDLSYEFNWDRPVTLSAGYAYSDAQRQASRYLFRYVGPDNSTLNNTVGQLRPDFLLSQAVINFWGINLQNISGFGDNAAPAYEAQLEIHAGYVQAEAEAFDGVRATLGVRYEDAQQDVALLRADGVLPGTNLNNDYFLPAATITWNFAEDMQLRLHASKTIARPQFRELAPQIYIDFDSNRQFFGNPNLSDSELYNLEARYEWFFARDQRLTAAGFFKRIENPIETIAQVAPGSSTLLTGFSNAPEAQLWGGEIEVQKYFPLDTLGSLFAGTRLLALANYTYTQSNLQVGSQLVPNPIFGAADVAANLIFEDGAPLIGQSDHLVNAQLGLENEETMSQATLLVTYASDRVTSRGPVFDGVRLPDIVERPGVRFDVVYRQGISIGDDQTIELKVEGRNLTRTRYQEFQTFSNGARVDTNTFDLGRVISVGLSARL